MHSIHTIGADRPCASSYVHAFSYKYTHMAHERMSAEPKHAQTYVHMHAHTRHADPCMHTHMHTITAHTCTLPCACACAHIQTRARTHTYGKHAQSAHRFPSSCLAGCKHTHDTCRHASIQMHSCAHTLTSTQVARHMPHGPQTLPHTFHKRAQRHTDTHVNFKRIHAHTRANVHCTRATMHTRTPAHVRTRIRTVNTREREPGPKQNCIHTHKHTHAHTPQHTRTLALKHMRSCRHAHKHTLRAPSARAHENTRNRTRAWNSILLCKVVPAVAVDAPTCS
jgi:hypothetical protein